MSKVWSNRFDSSLDPFIQKFNSSIEFDKNLILEDLECSIAHARMLGDSLIISKKEANIIIEGLNQIKNEYHEGNFIPSYPSEDIHYAIEEKLINIIGDTGKKLHTARSRNDQVATDIRIWLRKKIDLIDYEVIELQKILLKLSNENIFTLIPGYTHLQRAQPLSLAHHLLAYVEMFQRDRDRLLEIRHRVNICPLGSAALAGTKINIDRFTTAKELGFENIYRNSLDAVSDRDFAIEFISASSLAMSHLSRLSEEIILWVTDEFSFARLTDACATGSSLMPQKKNPDVPELIRGKTGRVYGNLQALLTTVKGMPLAYNKDFQEDKEPLFDTVNTITDCLKAMKIFLDIGLEFNKAKLMQAVEQDFSNATDVVDYLVKKGLPFREAYQVVGGIVKSCISREILLKDICLSDFKKFNNAFDEDIFESIMPKNVVASRNSIGGTGFKQIKEELLTWERKLLK
tara:strand:+ start:2572 stop:3951 length:1380 start_codon:yes stop_codon:yes gene_type:complete